MLMLAVEAAPSMLVTLGYLKSWVGSSNSDTCKSMLTLLESFGISLRPPLPKFFTELYYLLLFLPPLFEAGAIYWLNGL